MKLNNLHKNLIIFFLVFLTILICSFLWSKINLNISNVTGAVGEITKQNYSTDADTLRYVMFVISPLLIYFFSNLILKRNELTHPRLIFDTSGVKRSDKNLIIYYLIIIFCFFIFLEFLSINLPTLSIDTFHDGEILVPAHNYFFNKNFFISSYTIHGGSDIFYPILVWKFFGVQSIGATRTFIIILIFLVKIFCVLLAYQITKISFLKKETKTIFFIIMSISLVLMSDYQAPINFSYFSYRDIFVILFLIFFLNLFIYSKVKSLNLFLVSAISSLALLFHIDTGAFLNATLFLYLLYLLVTKKFFDISIVFISLFASWSFIILFFGLNEFSAFIDNAITIIFSMDYMHGIMYPEPFFSIGEDPNGARATRGLLLQIFAGLFVIYNVLNKNSKFSNKEKIFFIFLFFLSFIMYKNALGRSDSYHIRMSNDLPILINIFFISHFILHKAETNSFFSKVFFKYNFLIVCMSIIFIFFTKQFIFNIENIKNVKKNYSLYVNLEDRNFLDNKVLEFISYYKEIAKNDSCVQNFTYDLALPYLIKKPTCTKYFSAWLASPEKKQNDYINQLRYSNPNFIIYNSSQYKVDSLELKERLRKVNEYILQNYEPFKTFNGYEIYQKRN